MFQKTPPILLFLCLLFLPLVMSFSQLSVYFAESPFSLLSPVTFSREGLVSPNSDCTAQDPEHPLCRCTQMLIGVSWQICLGICKYPRCSSHSQMSGGMMGCRKAMQNWNSNKYNGCWLLPPRMKSKSSWEIIIHFKSWSSSQMDDIGFTVDLYRGCAAGKVNQEIMNRGVSCWLHIPSLTESLPTCLFLIT